MPRARHPQRNESDDHLDKAIELLARFIFHCRDHSQTEVKRGAYVKHSQDFAETIELAQELINAQSTRHNY